MTIVMTATWLWRNGGTNSNEANICLTTVWLICQCTISLRRRMCGEAAGASPLPSRQPGCLARRGGSYYSAYLRERNTMYAGGWRGGMKLPSKCHTILAEANAVDIETTPG